MPATNLLAIVPGLEGPQVDELRERIEAVVSAFALHVRAETHARVGISVARPSLEWTARRWIIF